MRHALAVLLLMLCSSLHATTPAIYTRTTDMALDQAYKAIYSALEARRFWIVFEADLGERMARFKDRWGDAYNRSQLSGARSLVFCNIWWTNALASADPDMLALCPLHISLYEKDGQTSIVMARPSIIAKGSKAERQALELEQELTGIIEAAVP